MNKFIKLAILALLIVEAITIAHGLEVRQEPDASPTDVPKETSALSKLPPLPAVPSGSVDTFSATKTPSPSASGSAAAYAPSGTGSLIPSWSALVAKGVPSGQPTSPPSPASTAKAEAPSSAHKIEIGLISGALLAGIVSLFF